MNSVPRVAFINVSHGGVPKLHVNSARATFNGLVGDRQADRRFHGGPDRALCLYSLENIVALQAERHSIYPGSIGENLTLTGIPWDLIAPAVILDIGDTRLVITTYTTPCRKIRDSFTDHHISRISQKLHPGWSRVYARVLREGTLNVGDEIILVSR